MAEDTIVGIDLGTTNSEVAAIIGGRPQILKENDTGVIPSCVGLDDEGKIRVGRQALNQYAVAPERTVLSIKRLMGSSTRVQMGKEDYAPQEVSAFILKALKERAQRVLDQQVTKAVITVPAYFTDAQRQATREAGRIAGLEVVRIINEPTAAALSYESRNEGRRKLLVYDLGGGTFDVSIVVVEEGVVEVLATAGDNHLGGDDFDALVVQRLNTQIETELGLAAPQQNQQLQARLRRAAEQAKTNLSDQPYTRVQEDHIGEDDGRAHHLDCELTRADFEEDIEEHLGRTMKAVTRALNDADILPSELDRILLVGGSTRIPRVAQLLAERLGQEPHGEIDPDLCVALGAAVQAGIEMGLDVESALVDITPYTFGTSALGELYGQPYAHQFVPLIRRNSKLPTSKTEVFYTMHEAQDAVEIQVYQGEDQDALKNINIGTFFFNQLNQQAHAHEQGILFTYNLNLDGILEVHAVERASGKKISGVIENALGHSTETQIDTSKQRVDSLWHAEGADTPSVLPADPAPEDFPEEMRDTLKRSAQALDTAPAEDREEIINLIEDLRDALKENRTEDAATFKQDLDEILFYLE